MSQQRDHRRNAEIPWNQWKWEHSNPKSVGHGESNPKQKIHSIAGLPQETRKSSNKLSLHLKELVKQQTTHPKVNRKKENN